MGLDQYIETQDKEDGQWVEYQYYRKFNELQGWFEAHYNIDNMENVNMTFELVTKLLDDVKKRELVQTDGFFYGAYVRTDDEWEDFEEELEDILALIDDGEKFRYYSWY